MSPSIEPGLSSGPGSDPVEVQLSRTGLLLDLERWAEAAASASRLLSTRPDLAEAWFCLSRAELGRGDPLGALKAVRRGLASSPEHPWGTGSPPTPSWS